MMVVTGRGLVTPLGASLAEVARRVLDGERAIATRVVAGRARIVAPSPTVSGLDSPAERRKARTRPVATQLALAAIAQALDEAALAPPLGDDLAVFVGVGTLAVRLDELVPALLPDAGAGWSALGRLHPFWLLRHLSNNALAAATIDLAERGTAANVSGVGDGGAQALALACRALAAGRCRRALVVAVDELTDPVTLLELGRAGLAHAGAGPVAAAYDRAAAGFVPGAGAAAILVETHDAAAERGARSWLAIDRVATGGDGASAWMGTAALGDLARQALDGRRAPLAIGSGIARPGPDRDERAALDGIADRVTSASAALGWLGAALPLVEVVLASAWLAGRVAPPVAGLVDASGDDGPRPLDAKQELPAGPIAIVARGLGGSGAVIACRRAATED